MPKGNERWRYGAIGALLGLGSPIGLLIIRILLEGNHHLFAEIGVQLSNDPLVYFYNTATTVLVLGLIGFLAGRQIEKLNALSETDPLTGIANRRMLKEALGVELARSKRWNEPLSALLLDVDRLKEINDQWGHREGDKALKCVAETLRAVCRQSDCCGRYGGDEFLILAPRTDPEGAHSMAERIRLGVIERHTENGPDISVSVGCATSLSGLTKADSLLVAADEALYASKAARDSRRRVQTAPCVAVS